jgi:hypothetical protein
MAHTPRLAVAALAATLAACAAPGASVSVNAEASGTSYFSLDHPFVHKVRDGLELSGRACRRVRTTLLTPSRVRIEHLSVAGEPIQSVHAFLPQTSRRPDQPCTRYSTIAGWTLSEGETIRACFDRGHACPGAPAVKIAAPAAGAAPSATP